MCSSKKCCTLLTRLGLACLDYVQGLVFLIPIFLHEILMLLVILSVCVGLTALLSFLHEISWFRPLAADIQAVIALVTLTAFGEAATLMLKDSYIAKYFQRGRHRWPCIFGKIPLIGWIFNLLLSVFHLYIQYRNAHPSVYFGNRDTDEGIDPETLNTKSTCVFLFSLSFLAYTIPRGTDWMWYRFRMSPEDRQVQLGSFSVYFSFFIAQAILLIVYSSPLLGLAFLCRYAQSAPSLTFTAIVVNGLGIGLNVAHLEDRYMFPTQPFIPPHYPYENHLAARVNLFQYVLIPLIAITYYGTGYIRSLEPSDQFLLYSLFIGMALLQSSKFTFNHHYMSAIRRLRIRRRREMLNEHVQNVAVEVQAEPEPEEPALPQNEPEFSSDNLCPEPDMNANENDNEESKDESKDEILHPVTNVDVNTNVAQSPTPASPSASS